MPRTSYSFKIFGTVAAVTACVGASAARAEIINLSCDNGGILLTIDTEQKIITDDQPRTGSVVVSDLSATPKAYFWSENNINYVIERDSGLISGSLNVNGNLLAIPMGDRHCVRTPAPPPKF